MIDRTNTKSERDKPKRGTVNPVYEKLLTNRNNPRRRKSKTNGARSGRIRLWMNRLDPGWTASGTDGKKPSQALLHGKKADSVRPKPRCKAAKSVTSKTTHGTQHGDYMANRLGPIRDDGGRQPRVGWFCLKFDEVCHSLLYKELRWFIHIYIYPYWSQHRSCNTDRSSKCWVSGLWGNRLDPKRKKSKTNKVSSEQAMLRTGNKRSKHVLSITSDAASTASCWQAVGKLGWHK